MVVRAEDRRHCAHGGAHRERHAHRGGHERPNQHDSDHPEVCRAVRDQLQDHTHLVAPKYCLLSNLALDPKQVDQRPYDDETVDDALVDLEPEEQLPVLEEHASAAASSEALGHLAQLIHHTLGGLSKAQRLEEPANTSSKSIASSLAPVVLRQQKLGVPEIDAHSVQGCYLVLHGALRPCIAWIRFGQQVAAHEDDEVVEVLYG